MKLYLANQLGWSLKSFIGKSAVLPEPIQDGERMSMSAQAKQMEMAFRGDSSGVLHTALLVDLDKVIKRKADIFWCLGRGVRHSMGVQGVDNKSFDTSIAYWAGLARGGHMGDLVKVLQISAAMSVWQSWDSSVAGKSLVILQLCHQPCKMRRSSQRVIG